MLQTWYPSQAGHTRTILIGDADLNGRLSATFGRSAGDYPTADERSYPGVNDIAQYDEGVFVGYRYFDGEDIEPQFPFGHGRSYADVTYGKPTLTPASDGWTITVPLRDRSSRVGTE